MTSKTKHTPGPWETTYSDDMEDGRYIVNNVDVPILIADVYPNTALAYDVPSTEEWKANARLIAAAPDLLASLKATLAYVADRFGIDASAEAVWKQGQAAIAKAEGNEVSR